MKVLITAGGTGGHIMPAIAIAEAIRERLPGAKIIFVGTDRGMEERIARLKGLDFIPIKALGIKGKSLTNLLMALLVNLKAFLASIRIIKDFRPTWVIGTGGYITGMVVLAGRMLGCNCAIQEQNSIPGLTNRLLARIAHRVFLAFPDSSGRFPRSKTLLTGNPLRKELTACNRKGSGSYLLILGGSLGASSVNMATVKALKILKDEGTLLKVIHQSGKQDFELVKEAYHNMGIDADVSAFIDDMSSAYNGALLALSRCGGITLSELSAFGIPAIMVPFPHATDDHQTFNGRYVADQGGGWLIPESDLTPERLALEINARLSNLSELKKASDNMMRIGLGKGAETIAREIMSV
jgi:UDP-N-acetylglucosamine--N-acetylmuramyl-(pentapeptide) pyrophosphoryl-undecaprenol N-acetylglucosamine transferase